MNSFASRTAIFALAALTAILPMRAQEPGPTAAELEARIATRKEHVALLREELQQADAWLEGHLEGIVAALTLIGDSKDSRTKVARMKEETMQRLFKAIDGYSEKRTPIRQNLQNPQTHLTREEKKELVALLDERIERRTREILALKKSLPTAGDYKQPTADGAADRTEDERKTEAGQAGKMAAQATAQRDQLAKQLDASVDRLERLAKALRAQLAATTDPARQKERAAEIARNDKLLAERRQQKEELLKPGGKPQFEVSEAEATYLDQALNKATATLSGDFASLLERFSQYISELTALHATEATLTETKK